MAMLSSAVSAIDPAALIIESPTLRRDADSRLARPRFLTTLLSAFAGFATLLALVGLYGVTAYSVQQREREIAVRLALGATPREVTAMFLRRGGVVVGLGMTLGVLAAVAMTRLLSHELHGLDGVDVVTLSTACVLMAVTCLLAIWWPSNRASHLAPAARLNES
jgi:ABC-type antimicrobial peptide transport system permease subunit